MAYNPSKPFDWPSQILLAGVVFSVGLFGWPFFLYMAHALKRPDLRWYALLYAMPLTLIVGGLIIPGETSDVGAVLGTTGIILAPILWIIGSVHAVRVHNRSMGDSRPASPASSHASGPPSVPDPQAEQRLRHLKALRNTVREWHENGQLSIEIAGPVMDVADSEMAELTRLVVGPRMQLAPERPVVAPVSTPPIPAQVQRPVPAPVETTPPPAPVKPAVVEPAGSAFTWREVGSYILSERTLIALLALGALMVLVSGFVISIFNPTDLSPQLHVGAVATTALIFFAMGFGVRTRLDLVRTGEVLLGIGGGFVPLTVWTVGNEQLLGWSTSTIWLIASLVGLGIYAAGFMILRDRAFSALIAIACGSVVLSVFHSLQIPLEWGLCAVVALAAFYLVSSTKLTPNFSALSLSFFWSSMFATPFIMIGLMVIAFFPDGWDILYGHEQDLSPYAVGTAWWMGAFFYFIGYRTFAIPAFHYAAVWIVPIAYLFTLTEAPWSAAWYNLALAILAAGYVFANGEVRRGQRIDNWRTGLAKPSLQVGFSLAIIAATWPFANIDSLMLTLYFIVALFAAAAYRTQLRSLQYVTTYLLPFAFTVMLEKFNRIDLTGFSTTWFGLWFAVLAAVYLVVGYTGFTRASTEPDRFDWRSLVRQPLYQVALILSVIAVAWPQDSSTSNTVTYAVLAGAFGLSTILVRQRVLAYVSVFWVVNAVAAALQSIEMANDARVMAWAVSSVVFLFAAEVLVRRSGESRRSLAETFFGFGSWRSNFASPLFIASSGAGVIALVLSVPLLEAATVYPGGAHELTLVHITALFVLTASIVISATTRQTSWFLYPAVGLFVVPATSTVLKVFLANDLAWIESRFGIVLAAFGIGYLLTAFFVDRLGGHFSKPIYLAGYTLAGISVLYAAFDRATVVFVLGITISILAVSAWLVHRERHPSFQWGADMLFPERDSSYHKAVQNIFFYLAVWLFPAWVALAMSLSDALSGMGQYGTAFAILAPIFVVLGVRFRDIRSDYSIPWYSAGLTLSAIGPLIAFDASTLRLVALGLSIGLYAGIAFVSRHPIWTALVTLLVPVWLWQVLDRLDFTEQYFGLSLVVLSVIYGVVFLALHHGAMYRLFRVVERPLKTVAFPFLIGAYVINVIGLLDGVLISPTQDLVIFSLSAILYGSSVIFLRMSLFAYPFVLLTVLAYTTALDMTGISDRYYGIGMLPGVFALFIAANMIRSSTWAAQANAPKFVSYLGFGKVETPFFVATYAGAALALAISGTDWAVASIAWWSVAAVLWASVYTFRSPEMIYPAFGSAAVAFASTVHVVLPDLSAPSVLATLAIPSWLAVWASYLVTRSYPVPMSREWINLGSGQVFDYLWARPLLISGAATLIVALIGSAPNAEAGLVAAVLAATLLSALATVWVGRVEAWLALGVATLALQHSLRLLDVGVLDHAPVWAAGAVAIGLVAVVLRPLRAEVGRIWFEVLSNGSIVLGAAAIIFAFAVQITELNRAGLDQLSLTFAMYGVVLITYAYVHLSWVTSYAGVASIMSAYVLRLVILEVTEPQAFALPVGIYLLVIAFNEWRRGTRGDIRHMLEIAGVVLILGTTALQSLGMLGVGEERYNYALILLVQSLAIFAFSAIVHWRNAFFAGIAGTLVSVAVFLEQPLRSMNTWYLLLIIGIIMLVIVGFIERRRQEIPIWLGDWRKRIDTWS